MVVGTGSGFEPRLTQRQEVPRQRSLSIKQPDRAVLKTYTYSERVYGRSGCPLVVDEAQDGCQGWDAICLCLRHPPEAELARGIMLTLQIRDEKNYMVHSIHSAGSGYHKEPQVVKQERLA